MGIQAISGSSGLDLVQQAVASSSAPSGTGQARGTPPAGGGGGGGGAPAGGASKAAASNSTSSSSSSTAKVYDKRDLNRDGVVSYEEEIAYALMHPEEATNTQASASYGNLQTAVTYNQQGKLSSAASGQPSLIDISI